MGVFFTVWHPVHFTFLRIVSCIYVSVVLKAYVAYLFQTQMLSDGVLLYDRKQNHTEKKSVESAEKGKVSTIT